MVKTKRAFVLASAFTSGIAVIVSIIGLATQEWVTSDLKCLSNSDLCGVSSIKFGLFNGFVKQSSPIKASYAVDVYCQYDQNVCALLCSDEDLKSLLSGESVENLSACGISFSRLVMIERTLKKLGKGVRNVLYENKDNYINAGLRVTTIIFLVLSIAFGIVGTSLSIWNTTSNPYQVYFSILGIYVVNAIASCSVLLSVILWAAAFHQNIKHNIPTYLTFSYDMTSENLPSFGYSFWILLIPIFFYFASISILYIRQYLISKEPETNVHIEDNTDGTMHLY